MRSDEQNPWKTLSAKVLYDNPWIHVEEHQVINPKGNPGIYGVVHFKNLAIGVLPLDDQLNTYLVGQFRYPQKKYSWEIPEGGGQIGIPPLESAKRELQEETGLKAEHWTEILRMDLSNSVSDEEAILFIARGLTQHEAAPEETEELKVRKLPFSEAYQMVLRGEITDSLSVGAILKTQLLLQENKI